MPPKATTAVRLIEAPPFACRQASELFAASAREGVVEALHRRRRDAGADLADAGLLVRDARVDDRQHSRIGDEPGVDAGGRAAEVEGGSVNAGLLPSVIDSIRRLFAVASAGVPPTNCTMAGDAAIAKPPRPLVSVMAESPRSAAASSTE